MQKFSALGRTDSYYSYLLDNDLWYKIIHFLLVFGEFGFYMVTCRRLANQQPMKGSKLYYSAILLIHAAAWAHANALIQGYPPVSEVGPFLLWYRAIANSCMLPVIGYCISYVLQVCKYKIQAKA